VEPELLAERYHLEEHLGDGGMARVYKAWDRYLERHVAVKLVRPEVPLSDRDRRRFIREAQTVAQLRHPNVVAVHDAGIADGLPFLVMELLPGGTLRDQLRHGPLLVEEALRVVHAIAEALETAHAAGILHLDVKPENIVFAASGEPRLSDFGISRWLGEEFTRTQNKIMGTAAYLAPEQLSGEPLDARADVYALGVVLYEMLTGSRPFSGETAIAQATQRLVTDPTPPHDLNAAIPEGISEIVMRALRREREARFPSARALSDALRQYEEQASRLTTAIPRPEEAAGPEEVKIAGEAPLQPAPAPLALPEPAPSAAGSRRPPTRARSILATPAATVGAFLLGSILTALLIFALQWSGLPERATAAGAATDGASNPVAAGVEAAPLQDAAPAPESGSPAGSQIALPGSKPPPPPLEVEADNVTVARLLANRPCAAQENEPNDTVTAANTQPPVCEDAMVLGRLTAGDPQDIHRIEVERVGVIEVRLSEIMPGADYDLYLYDVTGALLAASVEHGNLPEWIEQPVMPGAYYIRVYPFDGWSDEPYILRWRLNEITGG
jgi:eukaryotic-like serine/threonine-protein kinase